MESESMDPTLLFSPGVKTKNISMGNISTNGVKTTAGTPDSVPAAMASTKWLTQTRKEQDVAKKLRPQKLAVARSMLSSSARSTGKLRSPSLDPSGKTAIKGTGTSVTVVRRIVKVPVRPEARLRDSVTPDAADTITKLSQGKSKSRSKKGGSVSREGTNSRRQTTSLSQVAAAQQRRTASAEPPTTMSKGLATKGPAASAKPSKSGVLVDVARTRPLSKPSKRKAVAGKE